MRILQRFIFLITLITVIIGFPIVAGIANNGFNSNNVLRVSDKEVIAFDQMLQEIKDKKIVLVGESHDNPEHHQYQLQVIESLYNLNVPVAAGLEMFRADNQRQLDDWVSGRLSLDKFIPIYYSNWGMPWPLYKDIFLFARDKRVPLIGLNVSTEIISKVARHGFSSLTDEESRQLPPGISCNIDEVYMDFIKRIYSAHVAGAEKEFVNFCEAQMVWDNSMALHAIEFLERNPDRTVVILAGTGHSWKRGIPARVNELKSSYSISVILPEITGRAERDTVTTDDADYLILN